MRDHGRRGRRTATWLVRALNRVALLCMVVLLVVLHQVERVTWAVQALNIVAVGAVVALLIVLVLDWTG